MFTVYFATNRDITIRRNKPQYGIRFNDMGPEMFRVGKAQVKKNEDGTYQLVKSELMPEDLEAANVENHTFGSPVIFEELRAQMQDQCLDVITLITGFASTFESTLERAAELHDKYRVPDPRNPEIKRNPYVFVFSWPSDGETFPRRRYFSDRTDAQNSGHAMARAIKALLDFLDSLDEAKRCQQRIHLVAHSMGNWALRHAVLALSQLHDRPRLPRIFDHAFLMAADEDDDCFESDLKLGLLPQLARSVHVYHSENDIALRISDVTKANPQRLGAAGPRVKNGLNARIFCVDCAQVDDTGTADGRHQYYRKRVEVVDDVVQVLAGTPLDDIKGRVVVEPARSFRIVRRGR
ncbi:MAG: alpha/beta hydrolase [Geminicoccaceae bacterium]